MSNDKNMGALRRLIKEHEEFVLNNDKKVYVSVYTRMRCFGGPEEGGWWYTRRSHEGGIPFNTREEAEAFLKTAKAAIEKQNKEEERDRNLATACLPDIEVAGYSEGYIPGGWHDGGIHEVCIEEKYGSKDDSKQPRPQYE